MIRAMTESDWKRLLRQIQQGLVAPVIGSQLLSAADGQWLPALAAQRLLDLHGLEAEPNDANAALSFLPLDGAVSRIRTERQVKLANLYADASDVIDSVVAEQGDRLPLALQQIAAISDFRLLVSTTPDDLLARCLRQHGPVDEIVHAPKWPTDEWHDLPADWGQRSGAKFLLYLFGKARAGPMFALHEEDVLEYTHNIIARGSQAPQQFLAALQQRSLLLIGCNLPDWLGRFFLRLVNKDRLSEKTRREWLVDNPTPGGSGLVTFLRAYSGETVLLTDQPPAAFVAELHRRWSAAHDAARAPLIVGQAVPAATAAAAPVFFVSYSRQTDEARARRLVLELHALGATSGELWFDGDDIAAGQVFDHRIQDGIDGCSYFLPLLSEAAQRRPEAYVFGEWRAASERLRTMNRDFVIPLVVDPEFAPQRHTADAVRPWRSLDFGHAPEGVPDDKTRARLAALLRQARRRD